MPRTIAVTMGDPSGIGPEITVKALNALPLPDGCSLLVVGGRETLSSTAATLKQRIPSSVEIIEPPGANLPCPPGLSSPESARLSIAFIDGAMALAAAGTIDAIVTCPVSKEAITRAGVPFTGHTEYLANRAGVKMPVMMFAADRLKVSLVTTHLPLKKVPTAVTTTNVLNAVVRTSEALRRHWGLDRPRIGICGLNPHAGEGGVLGREEIDIVTPAAAAARAQGIACDGPFPADTLFRRAIGGDFDAVVAMYHDQALGVVKTVAPHAVNVTLGLPYVRTSVDHGTAFDIAGKGTADAGSLVNAIDLAIRMTEKRTGLFS